jgi:histidine ammonia-lyase
VPQEVVKLMLLLKIQSLSYGKSGVQFKTVQLLCELINHKIYPLVYQQGSLGASGDLAPLAHLSLPLLGLGKVFHNNKLLDTKDVFQEKGLEPINLQSKEGLALLNGTQFMSAYGVYCILQSERLNFWADKISSLSIDAFDVRLDPFKENLQNIRPHLGQVKTAQAIRANLEGSEISKQNKTQVQDPYSFRCIPQVHGATKDTLNYVSSVFEIEINFY